MVSLESANQQIGSGTSMHEGTLMLYLTEFHHGPSRVLPLQLKYCRDDLRPGTRRKEDLFPSGFDLHIAEFDFGALQKAVQLVVPMEVGSVKTDAKPVDPGPRHLPVPAVVIKPRVP